VKKHPQARLRVSFQNRSSIRAANQPRDFFLSPYLTRSLLSEQEAAHLALRANLRLLYRAPAPVLGCVYPSHPWLKNDLFAALMIPRLGRV
jgi:hypothetical protein